MRVLFCHDGPLRKDEDNNFYGISHNDETFKRYYTIAENLAVLIRVVDISEEAAQKRFSKITVNPIEIIACPNLSSIRGFLNNKKAKAVIELEVIKSDYIVARLPSLIGFSAINYARKHNKPYLVEVVACPWDASWNHSLEGKIAAPYMYFSTKKRVKAAPYAVYVTNKFLQNRYPCAGKHVACSNVSLPDIDETVLEKRLAKIDSMPVDKPKIIGTIAAVNVRYKGQQYIIKALGKLKKEGIDNIEYHLVGAGDNSYLKSVAKKYGVETQVQFLGSIPHKEVFDWLDAIDIYVQPSRQEGLPRALIEAMSRGLPSFGAYTGGIPELLSEEFIFSNSYKNIDEICTILKKFDKESMHNQARINFGTSKLYAKEIIEKRRQDFFGLFVKSKR